NQATLRGRWAYRLWKSRERRYVSRSAITNCLTEKAKQWVTSNSYKLGSEVIVTPCCVDFDAAEGLAGREKDMSFGSFICLYIGSMGRVYDDGRLFRTFDVIRRVFPGAKLRLLGDKSATQIVSAAKIFCVELSEDEIEVMRVPHTEIFQWI